MPDETDTSFLDENDILNIYRIAQESFTNIIKHSKAEEAVILIRNASENEEKGLYIFISDDGVGFDSEAELYGGFSNISRLGGAKRFGLVGMEKKIFRFLLQWGKELKSEFLKRINKLWKAKEHFL